MSNLRNCNNLEILLEVADTKIVGQNQEMARASVVYDKNVGKVTPVLSSHVLDTPNHLFSI